MVLELSIYFWHSVVNLLLHIWTKTVETWKKFFRSPLILKAQKSQTTFWKCQDLGYYVIKNSEILLLKLGFQIMPQIISTIKDDPMQWYCYCHVTHQTPFERVWEQQWLAGRAEDKRKGWALMFSQVVGRSSCQTEQDYRVFSEMEKSFCENFTENFEKNCEGNWVFTTNFDFLISFSLQPDVVDLWYFRRYILLVKII